MSVMHMPRRRGNERRWRAQETRKGPGPPTRPAKDEEPSFAAFAAAVFALLDERDDDKMRNLVVNDVFKGVTEAVKRYSSNFSYLNAGKNPYNPIGLGVGGQGGEMSRFYLTKDFCGHFLQTDSVFEPGHVVLAGQEEDAVDAHDAAPAALPLLVETKFQYEFEGAVELFVFGLGGREAEEEMQRQKDSLAKMKDASRKVDRRRFADNSFDREFLLGNTFAATSSDAARAAVEERRNEKK
eukprot:g14970.t1